MIRTAWLALLVVVAPQFAGSFELRIENALTPRERSKADQILKEVSQALPTEMRKSLPQTFRIKFKNIPATKDRERLGVAEMFFDRIVLNDKFLSSTADSKLFSELNFKKALAHELAHFYDQANVAKPRLRPLVSYCEGRPSYEGQRPSELCEALKRKSKTISDDPEFKALAGWVDSASGTERVSSFDRRLPNPYAASAPHETFPVFFESYLFEPDFACRMPAVNAYFNDHFSVRNSANCDSQMSWYLPGEPKPYRTISRDRIWAIDYFWASEGLAGESRFGHSMLRLVVCAPDRTPGPDCYKDFNDHIILSFGASSENFDFGTVSGVTGKYPLNLHASTFHKIKRQYNHSELRDLYAVPLKLSEAQKSRMIDALYETHWTLNGQYYFLTRNCTSEISRILLATGLSLDLAFDLKSTIPSDLFTKLLASALIDRSVNSRSKLQKNALLYFSSSQKTVDLALSLVSTAAGATVPTIDVYIKKVNDRVFDRLLTKTESNEKLLYAVYFLESIRRDRAMAAMAKELVEKEANVRQTMQEAIAVGAKGAFDLRFPGLFLTNARYGVPTNEEVLEVAGLVTSQIAKDKETHQALIGSAQAILSGVQQSFVDSAGRMDRVVKMIQSKSQSTVQ